MDSLYEFGLYISDPNTAIIYHHNNYKHVIDEIKSLELTHNIEYMTIVNQKYYRLQISDNNYKLQINCTYCGACGERVMSSMDYINYCWCAGSNNYY